ncbi:MAG: hypothetical protein AAB692_05290, partial [Patescibacteria group bacterium]
MDGAAFKPAAYENAAG